MSHELTPSDAAAALLAAWNRLAGRPADVPPKWSGGWPDPWRPPPDPPPKRGPRRRVKPSIYDDLMPKIRPLLSPDAGKKGVQLAVALRLPWNGTLRTVLKLMCARGVAERRVGQVGYFAPKNPVQPTLF